MPTTPKLGSGLYTFAEAAALANLPRRRVRDWFVGRPGRNGWNPPPPLLQSDYDPVDGDWAISFRNLVEVKVAGCLREEGLSTPTIREHHGAMEVALGARPFCRRQYRDAIPRSFVVQPLLAFLDSLDYDAKTRMATRWRIAPGVVLDPRIRFGDPIIERTGITTRTLAHSCRVEGGADKAASVYEVGVEDVWAAVRFEEWLAGQIDKPTPSS